MEILTGRANTVTYKGTSDFNTVSATLTQDGEDLGGLVVTQDGTDFSVTLPYLVDEHDLELTWDLSINGTGNVTKTQKLEVATPILDVDEVKALITPTPSDDKALSIERSVRLIIQAHCGQSFGRFVGKKDVSGSGESFLRLPRRLITLTDINGRTTFTTFIRGGGWYIRTKSFDFPPPVRADIDGWNELTASYGSRVPFGFRVGSEYTINGVWGYDEVPEAVREAARILVGDYTEMDAAYRDRYLANTSAADWRIAFNAGAYLETGNVRADQLLQEFVMPRGWVVI